MKFTVTMKTPDALENAADRAARAEMFDRGILEDSGEGECEIERLREEALKVAARWFRQREYLTLEIDTEAGTCRVL